jgi:hypothetical protein
VKQTYILGDYVALISAGKCVNPANESSLKSWREQAGHGWCGTGTAMKEGETPTQTTLRLIREGWDEGVKLMDSVAGSVEIPTPLSIRRRNVWSDQGDEVEMQRVWQGQLDTAWRRVAKPLGMGPKRVRVVIDSIASGGLDEEKMRWRGVAAMKLADALINAGYSVQVESAFKGTDDEEWVARVIVKEYTAPLDLSSLAATTALPAFFRALGHDWHFIPSKRRIRDVGYGVSTLNKDDVADSGDEAPIFLASQKLTTDAKAAEWVAECVKELQSEMEEA